MRLFLLKLALFLSPLVAVLSFTEWELNHIPNTLLKKRTLLEQRAPNLRVLVVGTSLEYGGVAPSQFDCDGMNMASPFQTVFLNADIVRYFAPTLPQLRLVLFGISYGAFEAQLGDSPASQFVYLYRRFLGTRLDGGVAFWDVRNFSAVAAFGQDLALAQLFSGFTLPWTEEFEDDGWRPHDGVLDLSREVGPPLERLQACLKLEHIAENVQALEDMLAVLRERHVDAVFISAPVTSQVLPHLDAPRLERTGALIRDVVARYDATYLDYVKDPRFGNADFADPIHLGKSGALKFSRILNDEVLRPRGICDGSIASPQNESTARSAGLPAAPPAVP
jgi:hypothetical protein